MDLLKQRDVVRELQGLAREWFGDWDRLGNIRSTELNGYHNHPNTYVLLCYNGAAGRASPWNEYEQVCRGLILEYGTGNIIAWPFEKFFNVGEYGWTPSGKVLRITEKLDGSLGILYRAPDLHFRIASKGSFHSPHAEWATSFLQKWHGPRMKGVMPLDWTLLFEMITPKFRNVVDYGPSSRLVLLGGRRRSNGEYLDYWDELEPLARACGFTLVGQAFENEKNAYILDILDRRAKSLPRDQEGWVIEMDSGERWKIKGDEYRRLHSLAHGISIKKVLDILQGKADISLTEFHNSTSLLPEEHEARWSYYVDAIYDLYMNQIARARELFRERPESSNDDRGIFAAWVHADEERKQYSSLLFPLLDNKPLSVLNEIVFRQLRKQYRDGELDYIEEDYNAQQGGDEWHEGDRPQSV